jgi:hypothetical protein
MIERKSVRRDGLEHNIAVEFWTAHLFPAAIKEPRAGREAAR